ncbi:MAG: hypothetical protein ABI462_07165 [Ignavibacteria bacterium]
MHKTNKLYVILFLLLTSLSLNGCLNVRQKTVINEDGSGTINLHYWMRSQGEIPYGDEIDGYSFIESEARKKYTSYNTVIKEFRKFDDSKDTTNHIELTMDFKNINKLSETPGFSRVQISYVKGKDGYDFRYFIPKDTTLKQEYIKDDHTLEYTFEFPKEVKTSNGTILDTKDHNSVKWVIPVKEHKIKDFEMIATVKDKSGICGLFGMELPLILIAGLVFIKFKKRKSKKIII